MGRFDEAALRIIIYVAICRMSGGYTGRPARLYMGVARDTDKYTSKYYCGGVDQDSYKIHCRPNLPLALYVQYVGK